MWLKLKVNVLKLLLHVFVLFVRKLMIHVYMIINGLICINILQPGRCGRVGEAIKKINHCLKT